MLGRDLPTTSSKSQFIYLISYVSQGMVPNLINVSHGTIQFVMYEELKAGLAARKNDKNLVRQ